MSNKTIEMFTIRQILRLYASGKGTKSISQSTGIARNTVKKYLYRYILSGKTIEQIEAMSDAAMSRLFLIHAPIVVPNKRQEELEPLLPSLAALVHDGLLPDDLRIVGTARSEMSDAEFRSFARTALEKYLPANRRGKMAEFLNRLSYQALDASTITS